MSLFAERSRAMNKQEFLARLRQGLEGFPREEVEERIEFYSEMIDDRIEEGKSEELAVAEMGPVDNVIRQIISEIPIQKIVRERIVPKKKSSLGITLLWIFGFPIWLPILIIGVVLFLVSYILLWSFVLCLGTVTVALFASPFICLAAAIGQLLAGNIFMVCAAISIAMICIGVGIFTALLTKLLFKATKYGNDEMTNGIKHLFIRKD
jgi:uncharacterized membrane protein